MDSSGQDKIRSLWQIYANASNSLWIGTVHVDDDGCALEVEDLLAPSDVNIISTGSLAGEKNEIPGNYSQIATRCTVI